MRADLEGFTIHVEPPFVVAGDEAPATVRRRSAAIVRWAVDHLKKRYFEKDPDAIIIIWLFKDEKSYDGHVRAFWNDTPSTPFGYYSPEHRALVMNIATGGGTLVHEIVHPFIHANFPRCPAWFNEGLASLYEQCEERDGVIWGLTNWRLAGLQKAIRAEKLESLEKLTSQGDRKFYADERGYAQARYLCYYLQEKGLLQKFYRAFVAAVEKDPTGYATLREVLGADDMAAFQKEWEAFALELSFP